MLTAPVTAGVRARSQFSFRDGASAPEELVSHAAALGYEALALLDRDGLYGSMIFAQSASRQGLQAITGVDIALRAAGAGEAGWSGGGLGRLGLLAETRRGYANLCRLLWNSNEFMFVN